MANQLSANARTEFLTGGLDWTDGSDWRVMAVDNVYVHNAAHDFLDDVVAGVRLGDATLTSRVVLSTGVAGAADADDASITAVDGEVFAGLWIYVDTGVEATSTLVAWFDTASDDTPFTGTVAGSAIAVIWPVLGIFRL